MLKNKYKLLLTCVLCITLVLAGYFTLVKNIQDPDHTPTNNKANDWMVYQDPENRFSFSYPTDNAVVEREDSGYLRVQNYDPNTFTRGLSDDQYFIEFFVFNRAANDGSPTTCADAVANIEEIERDGITFYKGNPKPEGGDPITNGQVLCVEQSEIILYVQGGEGNSQRAVLNKIFDSVQIVN